MNTPNTRTPNSCTPAFQRIKNLILESIQTGVWKQGQAIPAELTLAKQFGVSRMTVNRAMRELTQEQVLTRVQGSGTFVAQQKYQTTLVEINSIAKEIRARGHAHRSELFLLEKIKASESLALAFQVAPNTYLFHSVIVHFENDEPIQVRIPATRLFTHHAERIFTHKRPATIGRIHRRSPARTRRHRRNAAHQKARRVLGAATQNTVDEPSRHACDHVASGCALSVFGENLECRRRSKSIPFSLRAMG